MSAAHHEPVNLAEKLRKFADHWSPRVVAGLNDYQVKLAKIQGEFVWHSHADTDELFLVLEGEMSIELRDGEVRLGPDLAPQRLDPAGFLQVAPVQRPAHHGVGEDPDRQCDLESGDQGFGDEVHGLGWGRLTPASP